MGATCLLRDNNELYETCVKTREAHLGRRPKRSSAVQLHYQLRVVMPAPRTSVIAVTEPMVHRGYVATKSKEQAWLTHSH